MDNTNYRQNKNANNEVDIPYNFWLERVYIFQTFYDMNVRICYGRN